MQESKDAKETKRCKGDETGRESRETGFEAKVIEGGVDVRRGHFGRRQRPPLRLTPSTSGTTAEAKTPGETNERRRQGGTDTPDKGKEIRRVCGGCTVRAGLRGNTGVPQLRSYLKELTACAGGSQVSNFTGAAAAPGAAAAVSPSAAVEVASMDVPMDPYEIEAMATQADNVLTGSSDGETVEALDGSAVLLLPEGTQVKCEKAMLAPAAPKTLCPSRTSAGAGTILPLWWSTAGMPL
ncbi:MAG: hypothetical protein BJ554DRAFT_364 [Olpidium bornovanus]|uniref:Uncharacterized protein n=1 Tax=Olpidium bornovanus TaxID=278681 RepID=A0A8H7ZTS9_9FUNG|nr:MAG: hypothetical protein BJ554DRAFT_364 [Olpidium bornovanus]